MNWVACHFRCTWVMFIEWGSTNRLFFFNLFSAGSQYWQGIEYTAAVTAVWCINMWLLLGKCQKESYLTSIYSSVITGNNSFRLNMKTFLVRLKFMKQQTNWSWISLTNIIYSLEVGCGRPLIRSTSLGSISIHLKF